MSHLGDGSNTLGPKEGAVDGVFYESENTVAQNYSVPAGKNAGVFGPITVPDGVTITVPDGSVLTIV